jgi:uncharacterized protein (TIGR03000 family)
LILQEVYIMYSVVLMMALSGGAEVPDFGHRRGHGCDGGCSGSVGCSGYVGYGCTGGGSHGGRRHGHGHRNRCHGGGGCHGGGYCSGGCYGGGFAYGGCYGGGFGCAGGGYGGCYGGGFAAPVGYGGCAGGMIVAPPYPGGGVKPMPGGEEMKKKQAEKVPAPGTETGLIEAPATILVTLPAAARLLVDGAPTTSTSGTRLFISPNLQPGRDYTYTLRAEIIRDGQTIAQEQRVTVRAGEETSVPITFADAGLAAR